MIGLLYLLLCYTTGWVICSYGFPKLRESVVNSYDRGKISISPYMLLLPAWFITGTLSLTWVVYILSSIFARVSETPLLLANAIVIPLAVLLALIKVFLPYYQRKNNKYVKNTIVRPDTMIKWNEALLLIGICALASILMWSTFFVRDGQLHIGVSVFSDFSPHIGMIRSFSYGNNFPTAYSHYGGEDIRYHFMFQFLVGNLEFLGLRIDYAFNLPSILSFIGAFQLLYVLAVRVTGKIGAGILACLFFAFRSSRSFFTYLSEIPKGTGIFKTLSENTAFIGYTPNEDWGLWNLNVYCNQRHLAFGLCVMFFIIILWLEPLYSMMASVKKFRLAQAEDDAYQKMGHKTRTKYSMLNTVKHIFFSREGWVVTDYKRAIASGILLGALSFFHGSVVIGTLLVLFVIASVSTRRMEFAIIAALAVIMSYLQSSFFISGTAVSAKFLFGFIVENKTLFGVGSYLLQLLGVLPIVILLAFCLARSTDRILMLAFSAPLIFAFMVSLTVDVTVNHKFIMMSCILLGIFAAELVLWLLMKRDILIRVTAVILIILLTATGIYDFTTLLRKNDREGGIVLRLEDPLTDFVRENSNSQDLFLTATTYYTINQLVFGGAMLYQGHQYYAWSAGYNTLYRDEMVRKMYEATTSQELDQLVRSEKIRYIVVERANRESVDYDLKEENISNSYECVYWDGVGVDKISIYDTQKPIY